MLRLLVALFLRVLNFFALILFIAILPCLLLQVFRWRYIPGCPGFCCFRLLLCCSLACGNFCFVLFFLLCLFFSFFFFFCYYFSVVFPFSRFWHFFNNCEFARFRFFLVVSCALFVWDVCTCVWLARPTLRAPQITPECSVMLMWRPHPSLPDISPSHACPQLCPARHQSLLLPCFAFAACMYIPLHPSEPILTLLSPLYPFLSVNTCMHVLPGNFPAIHATLTSHANPFLPLLVLFLCLPVPPYPNSPIQTHLHPFAPVHTCPQPTFCCVYVYLQICMLYI